ncbi:MAG: PASTA domain-containing protein, partial [Bacteroidales bacterium]|nr:PASTA domain-containing protein [Bacteroidales bacterium]
MADKKTSITQGFFSNWIVKNLIWAVVLVVAILVISNVLLSVGTQHNKEITVPDFTNMTYDEARYSAQRVGLQVEIADSVYVRRMKKGAVFAQFPKGGSRV